ncbi:MAG TPA: roadblock/LC7 domain-containing protein [Verrucomicrobiae bacterium]|jgi:predicted regulator of Ras-like GTPase activity (Roadblock/LC7/MglB family)|nr:roadblock/LC7 domain-containing protein [Verrucomicrobiae bacterium]
MATLPQLIEEDVQRLDGILQELLAESEASTALIIDKGGFLITHRGESKEFDLTTIAALASGAYLANQTIANLIHEENFDSVYQQGEKFSMFVMNVDEYCLLTIIFRAAVSVGAVKYFALRAGPRIADQLLMAHERDPENGLDLSILNIADTAPVFKKKAKGRKTA